MRKSIKILLIIAVIACGFGIRGRISGEPFDAEKWKHSDLNLEENWTLRWDMMNSLRNNYNLVGMSKNEAIKLLGKPIDDSNVMRYSLGYSNNGINTGSLTLILNSDEVVTGIIVKD